MLLTIVILGIVPAAISDCAGRLSGRPWTSLAIMAVLTLPLNLFNSPLGPMGSAMFATALAGSLVGALAARFLRPSPEAGECPLSTHLRHAGLVCFRPTADTSNGDDLPSWRTAHSPCAATPARKLNCDRGGEPRNLQQASPLSRRLHRSFVSRLPQCRRRPKVNGYAARTNGCPESPGYDR